MNDLNSSMEKGTQWVDVLLVQKLRNNATILKHGSEDVAGRDLSSLQEQLMQESRRWWGGLDWQYQSQKVPMPESLLALEFL